MGCTSFVKHTYSSPKQTKISHNFFPAISILVKLKLQNCTLNFEQTKETKRNYNIFVNRGCVGLGWGDLLIKCKNSLKPYCVRYLSISVLLSCLFVYLGKIRKVGNSLVGGGGAG